MKARLNNLESRPYFFEREIWWTAIGHNIGDEEDGKGRNFARPVLILRKFNQRFFFGIPLTTISKDGKFYHSFNFLAGRSTALLSHMRDYDAFRLLGKVGSIEETDYQSIKQKLARIIAS